MQAIASILIACSDAIICAKILTALTERLVATLNTQHFVLPTLNVVAAIDGEALRIGPYSKIHRRHGPRCGGLAKGYKLHTIITFDGQVLCGVSRQCTSTNA